MINRMIVANILHRPMRTFVSIVAVAIQVLLVLSVVGITSWMREDFAKRQEGIGADILFRPPNAQLLWMTGAPMPIKIKDKLEQVQGIKVVAPALSQTVISSLSSIMGIDLKTFDQLSGGFNYLKGVPFQGPYDVLVDDLYASNNKLRVGDRTELLAHQFRVSGIVEQGKGARVYVPLLTLQDLMQAYDKTSMFYIKVKDPSQTEAVIKRIKEIEGLHDYSVIPIKEFTSQFANASFPLLDAFIRVIVIIACLLGFIVIYLSMYTTITERTREIGILKSLGASKLFIITAILREALLLSILGIFLGLGFTVLARRIIHSALPTLSVLITTPWIIKASLLAIVAGVSGGFYPSLRAASQDPIAALSYE